jgi:hypothetical protein
LKDKFNPSWVTFSIEKYWHFTPAAMTAGFLKDRGESVGTPSMKLGAFPYQKEHVSR